MQSLIVAFRLDCCPLSSNHPHTPEDKAWHLANTPYPATATLMSHLSCSHLLVYLAVIIFDCGVLIIITFDRFLMSMHKTN
jgi:hypothetical protein